MLNKERKRLKDVGAFTILDYIKTSIEILMNMKMEEGSGDGADGKTANTKKQQKGNKENLNTDTKLLSDTESMKSMDEPPKDYE